MAKEEKKAPAQVKRKKHNKVGKCYVKAGDKVTKKNRSCPKCGPGVFMGLHKDRSACGKCGYTEFAQK